MARVEFPTTLKELRERFGSEEACFEYLARSRWEGGFICPHCRSNRWWVRSRRSVCKCRDCRREISVTAGTLLHRCHFSLREWFWAAYLVATHTPGMSATQLRRQMGCSYKTAWFLLHRLRRAMVNESGSRLSGHIEADEVIIGGPARGRKGRGVTAAEHVSLVLGAVEVIDYTDKPGRGRQKAGRLRLTVAQRADAASIGLFLKNNVETGSQIDTDGWKGYSETALKPYRHSLEPPGHHALHIHRAFGNLKTWLNGTHHGVDPKYLQHYLDEFVFRFNRRHHPMASFQTLLGLATAKPSLPYAKMTLVPSTG